MYWYDLNGKEMLGKINLFREYPKAARHYLSLFPNNWLDIEELKESERLSQLSNQFLKLLDESDTDERAVINFIRHEYAYFIVGSILKSNYNFGHHDAYIIPEFMLGNSYKADYLLIGNGSGGHQFVFVELQRPSGKIILNNGELGDDFRKGIKQVNDWEAWLESNYSSLFETFTRYLNPKENLPTEFLKYDNTRFHYAVVAGRRDVFTDKSYRIKRKSRENQNINLLHYDNLYDSAKTLIGQLSY